MTVFKATKPEAQTAAKIAVALAKGQPIPTTGLLGQQTKTNNGSTDVPSVLLTPIAVTKDGASGTSSVSSAEYGGQKLVGPDGYWTADQICTAQFQSACQAAGIS
jgi:D-xylose transport system substrate-binding protein